MDIIDELQKLAALRKDGQLTEQEFADAKRKLLAEDRDTSATRPEEPDDPRPFATAVPSIPQKTYRSSRWSSGNFLFPDSLTLASDGMVFRKNRVFGSNVEHINYGSVASFRVRNGIFLSNLTIETSGGSQPIFINGLWKSAAREIQEAIRAFQTHG